MEKKKLWWRIRGLSELNVRFDSNIERVVESQLKKSGKIRILEIGFGEGRLLLDLQTLFPKNLELFGINFTKEHGMHQRSDFAKNAKIFGLKPIKKLPKPFFYDAGQGLHFKNRSIDVVLSQVAFHYVSDKARLLEEIWRVLTVGGIAFVHIETVGNDDTLPDFMEISHETPRFVIYKKGKIVKLSSIIKQCRKKGFDIKFIRPKGHERKPNLIMRKNTIKPLKLNLTFDPISTFNLTKIRGEDKHKTTGNGWWGTRSVYHTK